MISLYHNHPYSSFCILHDFFKHITSGIYFFWGFGRDPHRGFHFTVPDPSHGVNKAGFLVESEGRLPLRNEGGLPRRECG